MTAEETARFVFGDKDDSLFTRINKTITSPVRALAKGCESIKSNLPVKRGEPTYFKSFFGGLFALVKKLFTGADMSLSDVVDAYHVGNGDGKDWTANKKREKEHNQALAVKRESNAELLKGIEKIEHSNNVA